MKSQSLNYNSLKCIWMQSGIITYKLCNKNFNCDKCALDKVMRNVEINLDDLEEKYVQSYDDIIQRTLIKINQQIYSDTNIHLKRNLILRNLYDKTYYLGFNPIAEIILDNISSFQTSDKKIIKQGEPLLKIAGDWGKYTIESPINVCTVANLDLKKDETAKNWFCIVEVEPEELNKAIMSESDFLNQSSEIESVFSNCKEVWPKVGITLNDGGEQVKYIHNVIGNELYLKILQQLFNK